MVRLPSWQHGTGSTEKLCKDAVYVVLQRREKGSQPSYGHLDPHIRLSATNVTQILIRDGESFEGAIKRFTRKVQQDGVLSEAKRRRHYEPPSVKRKRKAETRARKARKAMAKAAARGF